MKPHLISYDLFESQNNIESLKIFLRVNSNLDKIGGLFEYFLMTNDIQSLKIILDSNKIDLNNQDEEGMTPIMHVIRHYKNKDDMKTINLLIEYGADLNLENKKE